MSGDHKTKDQQLEELMELATTLEKTADDVKSKGETLQKEVKNLGDASAETKKKVDDALLKHGEILTKHQEIVGRITAVEQEVAKRQRGGEPDEPKSIGERFVQSEQFKAFTGKGNVRVMIDRKDLLSVSATLGTNRSQATSLIGVTRVPGIVAPPLRPLKIRDLLASGTTNTSLIEYAQETGFTNNAAVVTEGSTKPSSDLTFELKAAPVRTIAHLFKASRQILDDAAGLQSYINARATYGLALTEESELLTGDGTGAHIKGLVPSATAYNAAFVASNKQRIDTIRLAILQVFLANYPATGIVLNPTDWAQIQLLKDSQQRYLVGDPINGNTPQLWNLPVVESISMTATEFLVGNFQAAAQVFDRMEVEILLSTENSTDFEKNMVTIRAEERLALAIYRPEAFIHGDFDTAT